MIDDQPKPFLDSDWKQEDPSFEVPLRPRSLDEFVGQEEIRERLEVFIGAALKRKEVLGHCLFSGPPGLGKTTLAHILAKSMRSSIVITSGPMLEKPSDLAGMLTNLQKGDVLFIDEIHRMHRSVEEYLYPAMEDFVLDIMLDSGPSARSVQVKLNPFTLVGATTRSGLLTAPMRSRFAINCRLTYYRPEVLEKIIIRSADLLKFSVNPIVALEVAKRSRGTPRIANHLLRWVRDFSEVRAGGRVDLEIAKNALGMLAIDDLGLDELDKKILEVMIDHYDGGPVGLNTLAVAIGEEKQTIEEVYEPFLILLGLIKRTPRGRVATEIAYRHLKKNDKRPRALF